MPSALSSYKATTEMEVDYEANVSQIGIAAVILDVRVQVVRQSIVVGVRYCKTGIITNAKPHRKIG